MPINRDLWQQGRENIASSKDNVEHLEPGVAVPKPPDNQPIINLHVNTAPAQAEAPSVFETRDGKELQGIRDSIRDLETRLSVSAAASSEKIESSAVAPNYIMVNTDQSDTVPQTKRKWPYVVGALALTGGIAFYFADDIQDAACEKNESFCHEDELVNRAQDVDGIPQESDINAPSGEYVPAVPSQTGPGRSSQDDREQSVPAPEYNYPSEPIGGDGEFAPGLPQDPSDGPILITNTPNGISDTATQPQNLSREDANFLLKQTPEGVFVPDEQTFVEWKVLEDDPSGQAFKIQLREIENNRYLSDQSFGRFMNSDSLTDVELLQFLYVNNIVSQNVQMLYVEFVGEDQESVLRTLIARSSG